MEKISDEFSKEIKDENIKVQVVLKSDKELTFYLERKEYSK